MCNCNNRLNNSYTFVLALKIIENIKKSHLKQLLIFRGAATGCLPNSWQGIPWLFPNFSLTFCSFPWLSINIYKLFSWYLSSQNQKFFEMYRNLILFLHFTVPEKRFLDFIEILKTFQRIKWIPWLFPEVADALL